MLPFVLCSLQNQHVHSKGFLEMVKLPDPFTIIFEVRREKQLYETKSEAFLLNKAFLAGIVLLHVFVAVYIHTLSTLS